jgi:hypothetical protein
MSRRPGRNPYRVTVGKKVSEGKVEVFDRSTAATTDATISAIRRP